MKRPPIQPTLHFPSNNAVNQNRAHSNSQSSLLPNLNQRDFRRGQGNNNINNNNSNNISNSNNVSSRGIFQYQLQNQQQKCQDCNTKVVNLEYHQKFCPKKQLQCPKCYEFVAKRDVQHHTCNKNNSNNNHASNRRGQKYTAHRGNSGSSAMQNVARSILNESSQFSQQSSNLMTPKHGQQLCIQKNANYNIQDSSYLATSFYNGTPHKSENGFNNFSAALSTNNNSQENDMNQANQEYSKIEWSQNNLQENHQKLEHAHDSENSTRQDNFSKKSQIKMSDLTETGLAKHLEKKNVFQQNFGRFYDNEGNSKYSLLEEMMFRQNRNLQKQEDSENKIKQSKENEEEQKAEEEQEEEEEEEEKKENENDKIIKTQNEIKNQTQQKQQSEKKKVVEEKENSDNGKMENRDYFQIEKKQAELRKCCEDLDQLHQEVVEQLKQVHQCFNQENEQEDKQNTNSIIQKKERINECSFACDSASQQDMENNISVSQDSLDSVYKKIDQLSVQEEDGNDDYDENVINSNSYNFYQSDVDSEQNVEDKENNLGSILQSKKKNEQLDEEEEGEEDNEEEEENNGVDFSFGEYGELINSRLSNYQKEEVEGQQNFLMGEIPNPSSSYNYYQYIDMLRSRDTSNQLSLYSSHYQQEEFFPTLYMRNQHSNNTEHRIDNRNNSQLGNVDQQDQDQIQLQQEMLQQRGENRSIFEREKEEGLKHENNYEGQKYQYYDIYSESDIYSDCDNGLIKLEQLDNQINNNIEDEQELNGDDDDDDDGDLYEYQIQQENDNQFINQNQIEDEDYYNYEFNRDQNEDEDGDVDQEENEDEDENNNSNNDYENENQDHQHLDSQYSFSYLQMHNEHNGSSLRYHRHPISRYINQYSHELNHEGGNQDEEEQGQNQYQQSVQYQHNPLLHLNRYIRQFMSNNANDGEQNGNNNNNNNNDDGGENNNNNNYHNQFILDMLQYPENSNYLADFHSEDSQLYYVYEEEEEEQVQGMPQQEIDKMKTTFYKTMSKISVNKEGVQKKENENKKKDDKKEEEEEEKCHEEQQKEIKIDEQLKSEKEINSKDEAQEEEKEKKEELKQEDQSKQQNQSGGNNVGGKACAICMSDFTEGEKLRVLHCRHRFHIDCIDDWLKIKASCPLCREVFSKKKSNEDQYDSEQLQQQREDPRRGIQNLLNEIDYLGPFQFYNYNENSDSYIPSYYSDTQL